MVCPHDAANPVVAASTSEACRIVAERLAAAKGKPMFFLLLLFIMEIGDKPPSRGPRGDDWFGLSLPAVRMAVQGLPGASECAGYQRLEEDSDADEREGEEEEESRTEKKAKPEDEGAEVKDEEEEQPVRKTRKKKGKPKKPAVRKGAGNNETRELACW